MDKDLEWMDRAAEGLEASGEYRVLRRLFVGDGFGDLSGERVGSVCLIDFETSGVEESDRAIEIGMVRVEYGMDSGRLGRILDRYSELEDPGFAIPDHISLLTGISDKDVKGRRFDDAEVERITRASSLIVAHNAEFDRGFGERRFEFMKDVPWACSMADVPWGQAGIGSLKLEFIAYKLGLFYEAHRAVVDCEATAAVLSKKIGNGLVPMQCLLENARRPQFRVWATGAKINKKKVLKDRGYAWRDVPGGTEKAWMIETTSAHSEVEWIESEVMPKGGAVLVEEVGAKNRFTARCLRSEVVGIGGGHLR